MLSTPERSAPFTRTDTATHDPAGEALPAPPPIARHDSRRSQAPSPSIESLSWGEAQAEGKDKAKLWFSVRWISNSAVPPSLDAPTAQPPSEAHRPSTRPPSHAGPPFPPSHRSCAWCLFVARRPATTQCTPAPGSLPSQHHGSATTSPSPFPPPAPWPLDALPPLPPPPPPLPLAFTPAPLPRRTRSLPAPQAAHPTPRTPRPHPAPLPAAAAATAAQDHTVSGLGLSAESRVPGRPAVGTPQDRRIHRIADRLPRRAPHPHPELRTQRAPRGPHAQI